MSVALKTQAFALTVDGVAHTLVLPLIIRHIIRLRSEVGWSQQELCEFVAKPDLDVFAVCIWLARLQAGENISFHVVADSLSYANEFAIGVAEDDHPQL